MKSNWADDESSDDEVPAPPKAQAISISTPTVQEISIPEAVVQSQLAFTPPFIASIQNLSYQATEAELQLYFQLGECNVKSVKIRYDQQKKSSGFATVEFSDAESLDRALTANGKEFKGRKLGVDVDLRKARFSDHRKTSPRDASGRKGGQRTGDSRSNAGGSSPRIESRPKISILPRSIPVSPLESSNSTTPSSIFGEGKARDWRSLEKVVSSEALDGDSHIKELKDFSSLDVSEVEVKAKRTTTKIRSNRDDKSRPKSARSGDGSIRVKSDDSAPAKPDTAVIPLTERKSVRKDSAKSPKPSVVAPLTDQEKFDKAQIAFSEPNPVKETPKPKNFFSSLEIDSEDDA